MKVVIDAKNPYPHETFGAVADILVLPTQRICRDTLRESGAEAVVIRSETHVGRELLEGTSVRFVGTATIGTDHIDLEYLRSRGIGFASAPGSNATSVAEYVVTALLVVAHRLGIPLRGSSLGVVGAGNVGRRVARLGRLLGMEVLENDPPLQRHTGRGDLRPLDALMECDFLSLHVPLTRDGPDATFHFFDAERLARVKPGAILLNTSRGAVVEAGALTSALRSRRLRTAVLDVWEGEPAVNTDLVALAGVATAHIAGYSFDGKINAARMIYEDFCRQFAIGRPWRLDVELPPAVPAVVRWDESHGAGEDALHELLTSCYDIYGDDRRMRALLTVPPEERTAGFRALRARYPVRREFAATTVLCQSLAAPAAALVAGLGFHVRDGA